MRFLVLGNPVYGPDSSAVSMITRLAERFPGHEFLHFDPNEDIDNSELYIIDVIKGIKSPILLTETDVDQLKDFPKVSAHDFDLAFMIKLYLLLGKVRKVRIIGVPLIVDEVAYEKVCSFIENMLIDHQER
ncbi:MAG: hypothetical protein ACP5H8_01300 [Candidatus Micrarchaeia archaeon]